MQRNDLSKLDDLFQDALITKSNDIYYLNYHTEKEARTALNLIRSCLPRELGKNLGHVSSGSINTNIYFSLKLTKKQFGSIAFLLPSFASYASNLRKVPNEKLYDAYLQDLLQTDRENRTTRRLTLKEKKYIYARKLWTDVVSETYKANEEYSRANNVKDKVLQRLREISSANTEALYEKCLSYVRDHSVITVSFNASFLTHGLNDYQLLNMWERDRRQSTHYSQRRKATEEGLFRFLPEALRTEFQANELAQPRYGSLLLLDRNTPATAIPGYGKSFLLLKDLVKLNALIVPGDSYTYQYWTGQDYRVSTIHHLEFLLCQAPFPLLEAIVTMVETGMLPRSYHQTGWSLEHGGYIEVLLPHVWLDKNCVESIFINSAEYQLKPQEKAAIEESGIKINCAASTPYAGLNRQFMQAIERDDVARVIELLDNYPSLAKIADSQGRHPIHIAAKCGSLRVLNLFAERQFDFTEVSPKGDTPLQLAAQTNQLRAAKFLLDQGVDINAANKYGNTALRTAVFFQQEDMVSFLLNHGADLTLKDINNVQTHEIRRNMDHFQNSVEQKRQRLAHAIAQSDLEMIRSFARQNATWFDLSLDNHQYTALHMAVAKGDLTLVKFLVEECHVSLNSRVDDRFSLNNGATPVFLAANLTQIPDTILAYLIEQGADTSLPTMNGRSPLAAAAYHNSLERVKLLANEYSAPNQLTQKHQYSALIHATERSDALVLGYLLAIPAININHRRKNGDSAISIAARSGNPDKVKLLLEKYKFMPTSVESELNLKMALNIAKKKGFHDIAAEIWTVYSPLRMEMMDKNSKKHTRSCFSLFSLVKKVGSALDSHSTAITISNELDTNTIRMDRFRT